MLDLLNIRIALGDACPGADVTVSGETLRLMLLDLEEAEEAEEAYDDLRKAREEGEDLTAEVTHFRDASWRALTALEAAAKAKSNDQEHNHMLDALDALREAFK